MPMGISLSTVGLPFQQNVIAQILGGADFLVDLLHTAVPRASNGETATFTRTTTETSNNNDGYLVTLLAGEIGFPGARRVRNQVSTKSADNTVGSTISLNVTAATTTLTFTAANNAYWYKNSNGNAIVGRKYVCSATVSSTVARTVCFRALATSGINSDVQNVALTTASQRIELTFTADLADVILFGIENRIAYATDTSTTGVITFTDVQLEDVTAQTTQTAGEYVSVGALDYRNDADPLYLSLPGVANHYASTPNSAATSITGDIDIRVKAALVDWTPAVQNVILAKSNVVTRLYEFSVVAAGTLSLYFGATIGGAASSVATGFQDGSTNWIRFTRVASTGKVNFYTSSDGVTWTLLGVEQSTAAGALDTAALTLTIGELVTAGLPTNGKIYQAQIYNTIGGTTPVVDFNPHRDATTPTGTITSSSTSEVWTINGASSVVRSQCYHGSMVDGVKCFGTDLAGAALPTAYTYDAVSLSGAAGSYVSTPDSVAASITGDIDIDCEVSLANWPPSGLQSLVFKDDAVAGNRSYEFYVNTSGRIVFEYTNNGSSFAGRGATSSASAFFSNGVEIFVRFTYNSITGKVNFYTSTDGSAWAVLGTEQTITAGSIFNGTAALTLGAYQNGAAAPLSGKIYSARIYNGIRESGGTLAVDFDASRYAGGTTLTGSTGETWTLNGTATIHPTNTPMTRYKPEPAAENKCLQSEDLATTWGNNNTTESVNAAVAPNGTTTADKLVEAATNTSHTIFQTFAGTSGVYTGSAYFKAAERTWVYLTEGNSVTATAYFDLANGVVGTVSGTGSPSARIVDAGNGWYRCSMTFTAGVNANIQIGTATGDIVSTFLGDITKGIYVWGAQFEIGSTATSYTPRGTAVDGSGTRNADVLTYTGGQTANAKTVHCAATRATGVSTVGQLVALSDGTANEYSGISLQSATALRFDGVDGGASQWQTTASNAYTPGTETKVAYSAATNSILMDKDGTAQTADTTATLPTVTQLQVGHLNGASVVNANIGPVAAWTRNLSQSELGAIDRG